ncbi:helix-turn-helix domain-containing protein [Streptomyces coeruleorubidus]|uniref:helix-turn-helix domain-containing protein n=1 Tax=Streptomyces coeruleorubidus TaxID=116188 RepID=UPI00237FD029|nr:helix-turn-helix domain-containing protein [Streptomyces coeruleorubidus]WDV55719.1 helix-turn-helix domain-containing protein [Streptomyces coeruleorubidus]
MTTTEPSPAATARPSLRLARERFLSGRPLPGGVPEEVVAAWRRARFFGVPHDLKEPVAAPARPVESALLGAARPVLDRLVPALGADRSLLVLTDERLRVLWTAGSVPGLDPCPVLSEQEVGNNSAALALRIRRRAEVHGPEHFLDRWQDVSAVSVPVFAPEGGRVAGTLTVASLASRLGGARSPHPQAALAEAAAAAVETELRARAGRAERVLLDAYLRAAGGPERVVDGSERAADGPGGAADGSDRAARGPDRAADGSDRAARGPDRAADGSDRAARGPDRAADGSDRAARGPDRAADGSDRAARGPDRAADGSDRAARGPDRAADGSDRAARGPDRAADGSDRAAGGSYRAVAALDGRNRLISDSAQQLLTPEVLGALERTAVSARHANAVSDAGQPEDTGLAELPELPELPEGAGCVARVDPVRLDGVVIGIVAVLEPLARPVASPAVPRPPCSLTGSSVPWGHAVGRAVELAGSPEPLLLTGERGTGKSALALDLLGTQAVEVADAALDVGLERALPTWPAGLPLLLRHAERLAQPGVAALNSLLDTHPDIRLLVTYTPGTPVGPCLQRLLDKLSARSVTLPPLRERTEDIRELLPALAPRPAPGQPPLTWTLDALRALERYPWPGNVTELAHVVRALAEHRRMSGPVRRAELPDAVREGPAARPLSPMEHAERAAILDALRRHGGNKARAAAALGIGRATLYRKLRGYRG